MTESDRVREEIERINDRVCTAYAAGDADGVAEQFTEWCVQMPPHSQALVGREALRAYWKEALRWGDWRFDLRIEDLVVCDGHAVERGRYEVELQAGPHAPDGIGSMSDHGNYLVLWRRDTDGRWRIHWEAPVSSVPLS